MLVKDLDITAVIGYVVSFLGVIGSAWFGLKKTGVASSDKGDTAASRAISNYEELADMQDRVIASMSSSLLRQDSLIESLKAELKEQQDENIRIRGTFCPFQKAVLAVNGDNK